MPIIPLIVKKKFRIFKQLHKFNYYFLYSKLIYLHTCYTLVNNNIFTYIYIILL